jgi:hypothetical protein
MFEAAGALGPATEREELRQRAGSRKDVVPRLAAKNRAVHESPANAVKEAP